MCLEIERDGARSYPERIEKDVEQIREITDRLVRCWRFLPCSFKRRIKELNRLIYILRRLEYNIPPAVDLEASYKKRIDELEELIVDLINGRTSYDGIFKVDPTNSPVYIFKTRSNTYLFIQKK